MLFELCVDFYSEWDKFLALKEDIQIEYIYAWVGAESGEKDEDQLEGWFVRISFLLSARVVHVQSISDDTLQRSNKCHVNYTKRF